MRFARQFTAVALPFWANSGDAKNSTIKIAFANRARLFSVDKNAVLIQLNPFWYGRLKNKMYLSPNYDLSLGPDR